MKFPRSAPAQKLLQLNQQVALFMYAGTWSTEGMDPKLLYMFCSNTRFLYENYFRNRASGFLTFPKLSLRVS